MISFEGLGTKGRLIRDDQLGATFQAESGFTFGLLDASGSFLFSESAADVSRTGGDLSADVTLTNVIAPIDVGGLYFEFDNVTNVLGGGLPIVFSGVRFDIYHVMVGEPFSTGDGAVVPEPATLAIWVGLIALGVGLRRRQYRGGSLRV